MHQTLYRKWRPKIFDDVYGQEHITSVLKYQVANVSYSHAYLFSGSRGTGKTTCAKILSKAVNCLQLVDGNPCGLCESCSMIDSGRATDIIEMDAASNTGVEYIRDIRDEVVYTPSAMKNRVYIIDEVHMLSISAFNALLKTLEEPPPQVIFILATTEPHKIPATVLSRCQRFEFRRIPSKIILSRLKFISDKEGFFLEDDAGLMIAKISQGGMRDAISLLELCAAKTAGAEITSDIVSQTSGVAGSQKIIQTAAGILEKNYEVILNNIEEIFASSMDIAVFWQDLLNLYRDMLIIKYTTVPETFLDLTEQEMADIKSITSAYTPEKLMHHSKLIEEAFNSMQRSGPSKRITAELALLRLCDPSLDTSTEALLERISALEDKLSFPAQTPLTFEAHSQSDNNNLQVKAPKSASNVTTKDKVNAENKPLDTQANTLTAINSWIEVLNKLFKRDPLTASFFRDSQAYNSCDGKVYIKIFNCFNPAMIDKPDVFNFIAKTLSVFEGRSAPYNSNDIIYQFEKCKDAAKDESYIDEIIE